MMAIIDGDDRMPAEIAEEQGFVGGPVTTEEVKLAVTNCLNDPSSADVIRKVQEGNPRPVMSLVGKVMKAVNRRGDPVVIKKLLEEGISQKGGNWTEGSKQE